MRTPKKLLVLALALVMVLSVLTACSPRTEPAEESSTPSSAASRPDADEDVDTVGMIIPDFLDAIAEHQEQNNATVGWLNVPGTNIDDVVLYHPTDNLFYERRGFDDEYSFEGVFYADMRSEFGYADELGVNTCIYGHALTDDPDNPRYNVKFGQLHNYREEEFARENPYMFFSTDVENFAFEIFAVFVANADNIQLPYNRNIIDDETPEDFVKMVREEILPRSKWNYDVEIKDDDKFLVLSTCIYTLDNGRPTNYPNTYMRYAIMGRLVNPDEPLKTEASLELNEDVIIDPDGKWPR